MISFQTLCLSLVIHARSATLTFAFPLLLMTTGCNRPGLPDEKNVTLQAKSKPYFVDRTEESGIKFICRNGEEADQYTILETLGGGVGLIDYDRDGMLDILLIGGGTFDRDKAIRGLPNRLFRNEGNWRFRDVTAEVGLPTEGTFYGHGVAVADYDNDGWPDLLITGYGRMALYHNQRGKFVDVTGKAGLKDPGSLHWSTSAGWGDLNGDGLLDLFVAHYVDWSFKNHPSCKAYAAGHKVDVCSPDRFTPLPHALYLNNGDGTFSLQTRDLKAGSGLGVVLADFNDDGRLDAYVANDAMVNFLYLNRGNGRLDEVAVSAGVAYDDNGLPNGSMGVDAADYDRSGRLSIFVSNFERQPHALYRNLGKGQFDFVSRREGITAIGLSYVGFGTGFFDFDCDGWEDLYISNGHVHRHAVSGAREQKPILLRNTTGSAAQRKFDNVSAQGGSYFQSAYLGRGVAFGDLDNDGRIDLVVSHIGTPVALQQNRAGEGNHWLGVSLVGKKTHDPVGARLTLEVGGQRMVKVIKGGGSYLSANDTRVVFGLGSHQAVDKLDVVWASGHRQSWVGAKLQVDRYMSLAEE